MEPLITFSTCWYSLKAKFPERIYEEWMDNLLSNVKHYNLVLYTDNNRLFSSKYGENKRICIVVKALNEFYNDRHKDFWRENHNRNPLLNRKVEWEVNMLWAEKVHFVEETRTRLYFPKTEYYGWIDIGYFRCRPNLDTPKEKLCDFGHPDKVRKLDKHKIHVALVNSNNKYIQELSMLIQKGFSIPSDQISIGGGCFIGEYEKMGEWKRMFTEKMESYITKNRLIKDDQIIIADCVFSQLSNFQIHTEKGPYDSWFLFTRVL